MNKTHIKKNLKVLQYVTTNTQTNQNFFNNFIKKNQIKYFPDKKNFYMSLKLNNKKRFSLSPRLNYIYNFNSKQYNINIDNDNNQQNNKKLNIDNFRIITSDNPNMNINHNTNDQHSIEKLDFNYVYILKRINRIKDKNNKNNFHSNYTQTNKNLPKISENSFRKYNNLYNSELIENKSKKTKFLNYIKSNKNTNKSIQKIKNFNLDKDFIYQIKSLRRKEYNPKNI